MHDTLDIATIVFAFLAVFVIWKLRSVLGTRTGTERPPAEIFTPRAKAPDAPSERPFTRSEDGKVIRLPGAANDAGSAAAPRGPDPDRWKAFAEPDSKVWIGLDAIAAADPAFQPAAFLDGAKAAYEMVVTAFASGDRRTLKTLLAKEVFDNFSSAITAREGRGEKVETTFVSIDKATIEDAQLRGGTATVSVRILCKLITATRDKAGTVIDGSAESVTDTTDLWTFSRETSSRDPNWKLVSTDGEQ